LVTIPISQASAIQRAGRAGRTAEGICYRLYPESLYNSLPSTLPPDITRVDLSAAIAQLKALGIDHLMKVDWLTTPPSSNLSCALDKLIQSDIMDKDGHLTMLGRKAVETPLEVDTSKLVLILFNFTSGAIDAKVFGSSLSQRNISAVKRFCLL
jgi:ATP-dependent RNA helicase DDX35